MMADPRMDDEPAIPEVVRWVADELTAVLFDGIVAGINAEDLSLAVHTLREGGCGGLVLGGGTGPVGVCARGRASLSPRP
jgi:hypothetical protein